MGPYEAALVEQAKARRARLNRAPVKAVPQVVEVIETVPDEPVSELPGVWPVKLHMGKICLAPPDYTPVHRPRLGHIMAVVSNFYKIPAHDIKGPWREAKTVRARHVFCWMARRITMQSYPQIGAFIGGRDHTTTLSAVRRMDLLRSQDDEFRDETDKLLDVFDRVSEAA